MQTNSNASLIFVNMLKYMISLSYNFNIFYDAELTKQTREYHFNY